MYRRVTSGVVAAVLAAGVVLGLPGTASAVGPGTDYCHGQCNDILPPGENGNATLADILAHKAFGTRPAHSADQLDRYANLLGGYLGLTEGQLGQFYNDSSFGVPLTQIERIDRPRSDVTILRDRATGVPHVFGTTRAGTMFGAGYAGAQDRLFLMDLMRHLGRGQLSSFAGGAPGNRALEQSVWRNSPYREADLQTQIDRLRARSAQLYADMQAYLAGVNAYIAACMAGRYCPGEYVLSGHLDAITNAGGPQPFVPADVVAIAGVVGGLFGGGGGGELQSALVRIAARAKYGTVDGDRVWAGFRSQNDPETVLTLHDGQSFPYGASTDTGVALPDPGTVVPEPIAYDPTGSGRAAVPAAPPPALKRGMSNAVVVSGRNTASGHPIAVFGPQTGYFAPQLLMLEELQGPGISVRGVAFAGLNLYVQIGRGPDYAWSATSAEQDITDTFAVPLCTVDGSRPTVRSDHYLFHGQCLAMDVLEQDNSWTPTVADGTPAGSYRLVALRTKYGLVTARATLNGTPVAYASLRSTYRHEADSALGFAMFDDPAQMATAQGFQQAAANVGYAFNWFYVNSTDAAYYNSGLNPVRSADPNLPVRADPAFEWQGWDPDVNTATYTPPAQHPNSVNQDYYVSWNNKQAKDYSAADGNFAFGPVFRADLLDAPVRAAVQSGTKLDRAGVVRIVEDAANTDLRGKRVLDELLRVLTSQPVTDARLAATIAQLKAWQQSGAHRKETSPGSHVYQYADAIRVFDAWWPLLVSAQFAGSLGGGLYGALVATLPVDEAPSGVVHHGSAYQNGWWGFVDKDLRAVLGDAVAGRYPRVFCGGGDLAACRQALLGALGTAAAQPATAVYPGDSFCAAGDQWCADAIAQLPLGGITDPLISWQNRPTYQQVVSFPAHR
jgi:acyl-homoserine lactone acylase PvdQ